MNRRHRNIPPHRGGGSHVQRKTSKLAGEKEKTTEVRVRDENMTIICSWLSKMTFALTITSISVLNVCVCEAGGDKGDRRRREWMDDAYQSTKTHRKPSGFANIFDLPKKGASMNFRKPGLPFGTLEDLGETVQDLIESGTAGKAGYGFALGYCSGYCVKKVARIGAFVIGGAFVIVQTLAYRGYVKVNEDRLKGDMDRFLDLNKDGRVDATDIELAYERMQGVLAYNLPSGGGYTVGLLAGLRT